MHTRLSTVKNPSLTPSAQGGFTLLEMVIVVMITSLIMGAVFNILNQDGEIKSARMNGIFDSVLLGMAEYYRIYGFYPCPASPTLRPGDPNYGEPNFDAGGNCMAPAGGAAAPGIGSGTVIIGSVPVRALNRAMGCTETDDADLPDNLKQVFQNKLNSVQQIFFDNDANYADYGDFDQDTEADRNTLNVTETSRKCVVDSLGRDIYGTKLTYAVTRDATKLSQDPVSGNIRIINRNGQQATADLVPFVVLSHGPDTKGAWVDESGVRAFNCGTTSALDNENCDNDAVFRAMPFAGMGDMNNNNHFDDRVEFSLNGYLREKDVWRWAQGANVDNRNVVLDTETSQSLSIGVPGTAGIDDKARLSVYGGNVEIDGDLRAVGTTAASLEQSQVKADKTVIAQENIVVDDELGGGQAIAPKFCYKPAITANCQ